MKAIFHIGMGKTGTSSVQRSLAASSEELKATKCHYLGMWPGFLGPQHNNHAGLSQLVGATPALKKAYAEKFIEACEAINADDGSTTFIFSNESLFQNHAALLPFFETIRERMELVLVAYIRSPASWLPSAYTQWGLHHKTNGGPLKSFGDLARSNLVRQYFSIKGWMKDFPKQMVVRGYDDIKDVVKDFADVSGIKLGTLKTRELVRAEPAQIAMRALYNGRIRSQVHPARFDKHVINTHRGSPPSLDETLKLCFEYDDIDAVINENKELFKFIETTCKVPMLKKKYQPKPVDDEKVRSRMFDYVLAIVLNQADQIAELEKKVDELKAGTAEPE